MHIDDEPIIAQCPLEHNKNTKMCYLSYEKLIINTGRIHSFELDHILQIDFKRKLLLLPLISGGVLAPLALIALLNDLFHIWVMLILFMSGALLIYYGFEGRNTLSIKTNLKEFDFFINSASQNLQAFVRFTFKIKREQGDPKYFLVTDLVPNEKHLRIIDSADGIELSETIPKKEGQGIFIVEPLRSGLQVIYKKNLSGEIAPYLIGSIDLKNLTPFHQNDR